MGPEKDVDMFDGAFSEDLEEEGRLSDGSDKDIFGDRLDDEDK
ncbi:hypothetical protein [Paraburkholderia hospita]|nr:hypothetical protein [Paraburkholderia hospita]